MTAFVKPTILDKHNSAVIETIIQELTKMLQHPVDYGSYRIKVVYHDGEAKRYNISTQKSLIVKEGN